MYDKPFHKGALRGYRFLVTGGAGFIGSHLLEYLLKFNAGKVIVLDNLSTGNMSNLAPFSKNKSFEFINGDIVNPEVCRDACIHVDYILHMAALGSVPRSVENPLATHHANTTGFLNMLVAARDAKVTRMVYAGSSSVYGDNKDIPKKEENTGDPLSPYAVTKRTDELYAMVFNSLYNLDLAGLRFFNIFGPRQNPSGPYAAAIPQFIAALLQNKAPLIYGSGKQTRDFTFVENAVQACIKALFVKSRVARGNVFNIATGNSVAVIDIFYMIRKILNAGINPEFAPPRRGEAMRSLASLARARKLLGYVPDTNWQEGLKKTVEWFILQSGKPESL
ncbi:MAG: SDR family oxidoreductase [Bacteroidetes bacterium]|nr:SDR family oxidoreductase [Bacteroidota bacterium]